MKKRLLLMVSLLSLGGSLYAATSFFRTPLSFIESRWGTVHYPLPWLDACDDWEIDTMGVYYQRNACNAYGKDPLCDPCHKNEATRDTVPLAQLFFNKASFTADEIFANGQLVGPLDNPFLPFVTINTNVSYHESGAALAFNAVRKNMGCDKSWFVGGRVALPISVIEVNQRCAGPIEELVDDFANTVVTIQQQFHNEGQDLNNNDNSTDSREVKAYRLDLLSLLKLPDGTAMVEYGTVSGDPSTDTRIAGQNITTNYTQSVSQSCSERAPVYVYKQSDGIFPLPAKNLTVAGGLASPDDTAVFPLTSTGQNAFPMIDACPEDILAANGLNGISVALADGDYASFGGANTPPIPFTNEQQDYAGGLANNPAAQRQLFVVPVGISASAATWEPIALVVQDTIERVLEDLLILEDLALDFFRDHDINFQCSDCSQGAGDTFLQFYGGKMCECWFADGLIEFRLPTGTRYEDPRRIYQQTTGNNGHFAFKFGAEGGYMPCDWLGIKLDAFFRHNFSRDEKRAAAFKGATVRNIGPCIDARVSWNEFLAHADFTFFSPKCRDLGWDFGYEFYTKTDDKVCFCRDEAEDFIGRTQLLDACNLEKNTNTQSHKIRGEIFNRWGCFQVFLGGSYIIAGRQVMKETQWHIGMIAYF